MRQNRKGQTLLEYILLVLMIAVTVAIIIRNASRTIYFYWTGLARSVASPCPDCQTPPGPDLPDGFDPSQDAGGGKAGN